MKRKFAVLTVLGALLALAVPAASSASIAPASAKFEVGGAAGPKLQTSLGSCTLKITGTTPASPGNATANLTFAIPTPTASSCTSGTTATFAGEWKAQASGFHFNVFSSAAEGVTLRFSSLPSCKLTTGAMLSGFWSNGAYSPFPFMASGFNAFSNKPSTWANDGGTCALAGKTEVLSYYTGSKSTGGEFLDTAPVTNVTSPTVPIIVGN